MKNYTLTGAACWSAFALSVIIPQLWLMDDHYPPPHKTAMLAHVHINEASAFDNIFDFLGLIQDQINKISKASEKPEKLTAEEKEDQRRRTEVETLRQQAEKVMAKRQIRVAAEVRFAMATVRYCQEHNLPDCLKDNLVWEHAIAEYDRTHLISTQKWLDDDYIIDRANLVDRQYWQWREDQGFKMDKWKLRGYDTFDGEWYALGLSFDSEVAAEEAAQKRLQELELTQPTATSGGQGFGGIQDEVWIINPDGTQRRVMPK